MVPEALDLPCHTGVILHGATSSALGRVLPDGTVRRVVDRDVFGIHGRSAEQRVALDLLLEPGVGIMSMGGRAGTGKSALALCAGLEAVLERRQHSKVIVFRPLYAVGGQELGYLPGTEGEKMSPWGQAVFDTLGSVASKNVIDEVDGARDLEDGLASLFGYATLDDSTTLALADGWVAPRIEGNLDLYYFGYGRDAAGAVRDFYRLSGPQPLLPRWALGNWWSRYYAYTAEEYQALIERFEAEDLPFSVAVLDMDWHQVAIDPKFGSGWTGYSWNTDLFPDPPAFLAWLHAHGLKVSLNVHPADGVRAFEDRYSRLAERLGIDPASGQPVNFDIADPDFLLAYLEEIHHPLEAEGVDFWWLDWQQGSHTAMPGLDPLWMLNHYHFLDSGRDGKRPITFSRYAGPGSHRYPVGFSGDTVTSWASLDFQPYFTATAANLGYGWWSHDIGGHMFGVRDDELVTRWFQLGVFSPINRLHSTKDPVSYTHLDVYKRQPSSRSCRAPTRCRTPASTELRASTPTTSTRSVNGPPTGSPRRSSSRAPTPSRPSSWSRCRTPAAASHRHRDTSSACARSATPTTFCWSRTRPSAPSAGSARCSPAPISACLLYTSRCV